jgi:NitT/TauT family transport system substrate-binding protein
VTLAGTAGLLGLHSRPVAAEPPPETTTLRLVQGLGLCVAPQYVAEELLQAEGFIEVHSVKTNTVRDIEVALASGDAHLGMHFAAPLVVRLDQADPITILAGMHIGCFELFGTERIRTIRDLKGKTVAVPDL